MTWKTKISILIMLLICVANVIYANYVFHN